MDMRGEHHIFASREEVWAALNDVDVLRAAIPGCDSITKLSETQIEAVVAAKIGPVKATFRGSVTLSDLDPPNGYTISGEGNGAAAGFARGGAKVLLVERDGGTLLTYEVTASVGGKLAQIGSRLVDSSAKKLADQFFQTFGEIATSSNKASGNDELGSVQAGQEPPHRNSLEPSSLAVPAVLGRGPDPIQNFQPITFKAWATIMVVLVVILGVWILLI